LISTINSLLCCFWSKFLFFSFLCIISLCSAFSSN